MSVDHKPEDDIELARIEKAGGAVVDGRVQVRKESQPRATITHHPKRSCPRKKRTLHRTTPSIFGRTLPSVRERYRDVARAYIFRANE